MNDITNLWLDEADYVCIWHDEAIVFNHMLMMEDLAESALWLFPFARNSNGGLRQVMLSFYVHPGET